MRIYTSYHVRGNRISFAVILADLIDRGYRQKFRREPAGLRCDELCRWFSPDQFNVDEAYDLEAFSGPDVERIVYAITTHSGTKGILVDAYGVYAGNMSLEMFQKLRDRKEWPSPGDEHEIRQRHLPEMAGQKANNEQLPVQEAAISVPY